MRLFYEIRLTHDLEPHKGWLYAALRGWRNWRIVRTGCAGEAVPDALPLIVAAGKCDWEVTPEGIRAEQAARLQ